MSWEHETEVVSAAIAIAGAEALRYAADGFETFTKADQSPVTSADLAVNQILQTRLLDAFPDDGWLSEESPDSPARLDKKRVWVIDPIDGTSAFVDREPEFCISVALVSDGRPVVAAIYNPSTAELYMAIRGDGLRLNGRAVSPPRPEVNGPPIIALSHWEEQRGRFKAVEPHIRSRPMRSIAWAMALAAGGRIHAVATFESQNEWDIAAGSLLVEEAGGRTTDGSGGALRFNRPEPRYQGIIATSRHLPAAINERIRSLSAS
jgi:myo-inositol-1(or 4)-monophosphatase